MLRGVALLSLFYDVIAGVTLGLLRGELQTWFGLAAPQPAIYADLNAIFVTCVGLGYLLPYRDPVRYRSYMWLFGVVLKTAGAAAFLLDYFLRGSPTAFLIFAASDAAVAALTLFTLVRDG
jgi:hypothetical protein